MLVTYESSSFKQCGLAYDDSQRDLLSLTGTVVKSFHLTGEDKISATEEERSFIDDYMHKANTVRLGDN